MIEKRAIKFYLDESVNRSKKDKITQFLKECQDTENQLLKYYWDNFYTVINSPFQIDFNYNNKINFKDITPRLKCHHFQQVLQKVYTTLKSIQKNIINNKIRFKFDDKSKQRIYDYCKGFCFNWDNLQKYNEKQLKKHKKNDKNYYEFLLQVKSLINNEKEYEVMKQEIESMFWGCKDKYKTPMKKEFQILCNTAHTVDIELKEFQWVFVIDSNTIIGGTEKKGVYDKLIIPVKYGKYHRDRIGNKKLANTFNLKLNRYGRVEVIGVYEEDVIYPISNTKEIIGVDIGLKKLITTSDGEIVEQDKNVLYKLSKVVKRQSNRDRFEYHLQEKYGKDFRLPNKRYLKQQVKLSDYIKTNNRYKIKNFLKGRNDFHIILEDLQIGYSKTHSKKTNYLLKRLEIQNIKNDLLKYAIQFGIKTTLINASYTSQQCPICGHVSKNNRKTQEMFCCVKCNHTDNADHNASVNILNRFYDDRIGLNTPMWRIREVLNIQ